METETKSTAKTSLSFQNIKNIDSYTIKYNPLKNNAEIFNFAQ